MSDPDARQTTDMAKRDDPLEPHPHGHRWGPDGICDHPACTATKPPTQTTDDRTYPERLMDVTDEQLTELLRFWSEAQSSQNIALWMVASAFLSDVQREVARRATVAVPRWALQFVMDNACFQDVGPIPEGWRSDGMLRATEALDKALEERTPRKRPVLALIDHRTGEIVWRETQE